MPDTHETLLDQKAVQRMVRRMAGEIVEQIGDLENAALVGIRRGGVPLSSLLLEHIHSAEDATVPVGTVDISLYRDDAATALPNPQIGPSRISFDVSDRQIVLVDDVLQTGRTVRAAIDCLLDFGRPKRVWLAVLCDRGGRELPFAADFCGMRTEIDPTMELEVLFGDNGATVEKRSRP